ncbi:M23 family metallopeptidase [Micromonospora sp. KC207]|uniref:murein hydrolase activator EnvC family protein n=1 Tax=Micromonospora sp. KC207 TaxID=2530377 RepID=UPI0010531765|nr:M23 family metallopeptidase [Micromonospora sp. KC207]TDC44866.1 M23 family metallopeptidase [Micromonospora sp. KC207]
MALAAGSEPTSVAANSFAAGAFAVGAVVPAGQLRATAHPAAGPVPGLAPVASVGVEPATAAVPVRFRWPLDGVPRPARRFEPPPQPWLPGHRGVDLIAEPGAVVRAAGSGVVLFAGQVAGRPVVTVGHTAGLRTTYEPVLPGVRAGDQVALGVPLGQLRPGHVGCPGGTCLHWGLRRGEEYLDPLALLGLGPVRLLPP